ncbi:hypothetical protein M9Y10_015590 [Tritrichomonas musculus]|uniref:Haloacid dehalogenase-like hydrolase family protein n=1 Tax=Tritrichomonas musculus TaxID=1915356 RepID=A0ABR2L366_9EUKA
MNIKAVFCDIDGTLLNDQHEITLATKLSIQNLQKKNIKFVLVSGRSPSGIYSIIQNNFNHCPIISYNGAIILDENKKLIYQKGMTHQKATQIINYIEENNFDLTWNLFSFDDWITQNRQDPQVQLEEKSLQTFSKEGQINSLPADQIIHNILCMCNPQKITEIWEKISKKFPDCTVVKSSKTFIDIMVEGVNKAEAVSYLCKRWNVDVKDAAAFGDNYNDCEMLETVGHGIVMGNAPEDIRNRFSEVTLDNNHDGISVALKKMKIID